MDPFHFGGDQINQVAFTDDGQRVFVSTVLPDEPISLSRAALIDVASGKRLFTRVATNLVRAEFIAAGRWLVTAGSDHVIRVLDGRDGNQVAALKGHTRKILAFSSSRNGDLLASTSTDGTIRLWRLPSGEPVGAPLPFQPPQHGPVLSPDGQRLATREQIVRDVATNSYVRIWRTEPLARIGEWIESPGTSGSMWFDSAASRRLFVAFGNQVRVFDADTQATLFPAIQFDKPVSNWAMTPDGRRLIWSVGGRG